MLRRCCLLALRFFCSGISCHSGLLGMSGAWINGDRDVEDGLDVPDVVWKRRCAKGVRDGAFGGV